MSDIADIIARLEKATGRDIEVEKLIGQINPSFGWIPYTSSIDAALTLVPEGYQAYVDTGDGIGNAHACVWTDYPHRIQGGARQIFSPAIALCIAALRARVALSGS